MKDNLSLSVGNTIEFGYKIIHNYLSQKQLKISRYLIL